MGDIWESSLENTMCHVCWNSDYTEEWQETHQINVCIGLCEMYRWRKAFHALFTHTHERISMPVIRRRKYQRTTSGPSLNNPSSFPPQERKYGDFQGHCIEMQTGLNCSPLKKGWSKIWAMGNWSLCFLSSNRKKAEWSLDQQTHSLPNSLSVSGWVN